jgi:hypothetical protein
MKRSFLLFYKKPMSQDKKARWQSYCSEQLSLVTPLLLDEGFELEEEQPHLIGERYILSGPKLVLYGARKSDGLRVVIKISNNTKTAQELLLEHEAREALSAMHFAYKIFHSPREVLSGHKGAYTFYITEYIPQEKKFLEYSLEDQFFFALKAFEAQEGSHATTHGHLKTIEKTFEVFDAKRYIDSVRKYKKEVENLIPEKKSVQEVFAHAVETLENEKKLLDTYSNFLTHWDFVPHNIRIHERNIYLLDHTAIRFGNKYEGWARFMNFMTLYNAPLEQALDTYIQENRSTSEHRTLELMRLYRLCELVWFYVKKRESSEGNLRTLTNARTELWSKSMEAQLQSKTLGTTVIENYKKIRDDLRDADEKQRQDALH